MPSVDDHRKQFNSNKISISNVQTLEKPPNDWLVTMAFYAAIHLVESIIVTKMGKFTENHNDRKLAISRISELKSIRSDYLTLESYSHKSRYLCKTFSDKDVSKVLGVLKKIEDELSS